MNKVMNALQGRVDRNDVVYSVLRRKKLGFWKRLLDIVVTYDLFNDAKTVADNANRQFFLVAGDRAATIVTLRDGVVVDSFDVPGWQPGHKESFRSVLVDGYEYRKVVRENR